ncbi:hypothetical protein FHT08_002746 [Xanthomonas campestris]|nr:hypothetical protein [Xanthomonas sp. CFBP 8151]
MHHSPGARETDINVLANSRPPSVRVEHSGSKHRLIEHKKTPPFPVALQSRHDCCVAVLRCLTA